MAVKCSDSCNILAANVSPALSSVWVNIWAKSKFLVISSEFGQVLKDMTAPTRVAGRGKSKATTPSASSSPSEIPADKSKREGNFRNTQDPQNTNLKLKVVVRGLPPNLPESVFKETTKVWINENTVDWYYYVGGKLPERYAISDLWSSNCSGNKPNVRSRAYAKFKSLETLVTFHKDFNGHIFADSKGANVYPQMLTIGRSSRAVIEFAPFQKFVKGKTKTDARQGTIDTSPEYKEFLDSLAQPPPPPSSFSDPIEVEEEHKTTPLIEYLRTQKTAKAEKDKINREKARVAKIAALQAKANAQTAKLQAERTQKAAVANKSIESGKQGVADGGTPPAGGTGRGRGRGGKSGGRGGKDGQRSKAQQREQQQQQQKSKSQEGPIVTSMDEALTNDIPVNSTSQQNTSPPLMTSPPTSTANTENEGSSSGQGFRGRGRGRARPHGVFRPGAGRGGRRGGGKEGKSSASAADG
jgi:regulator of nonsense transcripts 3